MSTECVSSLDLSEDMLDKQGQHCKLLDNLSEQLRRNCDIQMKVRKGKTDTTSQNNEMDLKQPRRKDTPALHKPPFIPDFSELLLKRFDEVEKQQKNMKIPSLLNKDAELRKPRRKDTPALHTSPLLPGAKSMKEDRRTIIVESEESDG
ncbi:protein phosphatase 1 regulatory subunit 17 [Bufo gargarizans]|uniref:protein phosphatase 1 regulatory subunit 17 n=1 Tax=Bufo gargarizans TaxID=30331 RepID=UPI001CF26318|nr:protein phosphatase 1 regulatory subunit 17 [Bufo gargarizans]